MSENQRGGERQRCAIETDRLNLTDARRALRRDRHERLDSPEGEQDAQDASDDGQQQALGEELADEPSPARAEREPDGDFAGSPRRANEQKVGDVRARDEQHEAHGRKQHEQTLTNVAHHLQMQGDQVDSCLRVPLGVGRCELRREEIG